MARKNFLVHSPWVFHCIFFTQRWNLIRPDRSVRAWTNDEDAHLLAFQKENGNRWSDCAKSVSAKPEGQGARER